MLDGTLLFSSQLPVFAVSAMAQAGVGSQASRLAKDLTLAGQSTTTIPKLVYGTAWKKERTADLVYSALKAGFRGIDTAAQPKHYDELGVATGVKRAIAQGIITRGNLFVCATSIEGAQ